MITVNDIEDLKGLLSESFKGQFIIEEKRNPIKPSDGPILIINNRFGIWATTFLETSGYEYTVEEYIKAAPPEIIKEKEYPSWELAVFDLVGRIAAHNAAIYFDRKLELEDLTWLTGQEEI